MAVTMPARRSSLFGGHGTGAGWDWSSLDDTVGNDTTTFRAEDYEDEDEDEDEDEQIEENITVAAGPATPLPRALMKGKIAKRDITALEESDNEEDENDDEIMHDEIIVAPSPHAPGKRSWDDTPSSFPNKKVKIDSASPDTTKPASSYLHGIFAAQTPRKASPVAQLRSPTTGIAAKPLSRFSNISPRSRRSIPAARPLVRKPSTPFIEIEDSDENDEVVEVPAVPVKLESLASGSHNEMRDLDPMKAAQKENQRLTSLRLRQEATERKMRAVTYADDVKTDNHEHDMQHRTDDFAPVVEHDSPTTHDKQAPEVHLKAKPTTDLSTSLDRSFLNSINPIPALTNMFRKPVKSDGVLELRPPPPTTSNAHDPAPTRPPLSTPKTTHIPSLLLNSDEEEQRRIRAAKAKQREDSVAAQIRAQAYEARKNELAVREAREKREAEERAEIDIQVAREAKAKGDEAKKRDDEATKRADQWKKGMERKRQEEADKRQKIMDVLKAQKVAEERREKARKDAEARKREDELRRKQAEARSGLSSLPAPGGLALPPPLPKVLKKVEEPIRPNGSAVQQKPEEPATRTIAEAEGRFEPAQAAAGPSGTTERDGEPGHSAPNLDDKALREERVRLMKERNARNKVTTAEEELPSPQPPKPFFVPLPAITSTPPAPVSTLATGTLADGPISLNSAARIAAVAQSNRVSTTRNTDFSWDEEYHKCKYGAKLNTLTVGDIKLFVWSEQKVPWEDTCQMYYESTGRQLSGKTLQRRSKQIKEVLLELDPEPGQLNRAAQGELQALDHLNALVDAKRPITAPYKFVDASVQSAPATAADIRLLRLREEGTGWALVIERCKDLGMPWRTETTLRRRYNLIKDLVQSADMDEQTLDLAEAGVQSALDRLNSAVCTPRPDTVTKSHTPVRQSTAKRSLSSQKVDPTLGEIAPHDIQLMQWRDGGETFANVTVRLRELTGVDRDQQVIYQRYKKVKAAIDHVRGTGVVDDDLLDDAMIGEQEAIKRLNMAVHGEWPVPAFRGAGRRPKVPHTVTRRKDSVVSDNRKAADNESSFTSETFDEDFWTNTEDLSPDSLVARDATGRATEGGKSVSLALFKASFEAMADLYAAESAAGVAEEAQPENAVTDEDKCHFVYQVQRRELSQEEALTEEPVEIESKPWLDVGAPLVNLRKASLMVGEQMWLSNDETTATAIAEGADHRRRKDENGLPWARTDTEDAGVVEVRIERRLRSHQEGIIPKASAFELSRNCFHVKKCVTMKPNAEQELFGEAPTQGSDPPEGVDIANDTYTILELANGKAIEYFTKVVQFPPGIELNMSKRDTMIRDAKDHFWRELRDQGEKALFDQEVEYEDESKEVRVWVEPGRLVGPRNV